MAKIIRVRSHTPDTSPGIILAAVVLVLFYTFWEINWISILICVILVPFFNWLLVGRTTKKDIFIDQE